MSLNTMVEVRATRSCAINYLQQHYPATAGKLRFRPKPVQREVHGYGFIWTFSVQLVSEDKARQVEVLIDYTNGVSSVLSVR